MWRKENDPIVIGTKTWNSYSSTKIFNDKLKEFYISSNNIFYQTELSVFKNQEIFICKNTPEGEKIKEYLNSPDLKTEELQNYIDTIGLNNLNIEQIKALIAQEKELSFALGKRETKMEIKNFLFGDF